MSSISKGMLALLRDLLAHEPRTQREPHGASGLRPAPSGRRMQATRTYDLATEAGGSHWYTAIGSPLLGERLPALRAALDAGRASGLN